MYCTWEQAAEFYNELTVATKVKFTLQKLTGRKSRPIRIYSPKLLLSLEKITGHTNACVCALCTERKRKGTIRQLNLHEAMQLLNVPHWWLFAVPDRQGC
jgi:hypothetical protein